MYVPSVYRHDKGLWPPTTPSCLYYRWQRGLWDLFAKFGNFNFIWKAGPRTSNLEDPIKDLRADNIRYSTKKLSRELGRADMVIVDMVSTPMWEALVAGIPTICVRPIFFDNIRQDILDVLGEKII